MSCNPPSFRFCPCCGGELEKREVNGQPRLVCGRCRQVLYVNPAVGVAVVVRRGNDILWGRRAGGPHAGSWCLPCGYAGGAPGGRRAPADDLDAAAFFPLTAPPSPLAFPTDAMVLAELRAGKLAQ